MLATPTGLSAAPQSALSPPHHVHPLSQELANALMEAKLFEGPETSFDLHFIDGVTALHLIALDLASQALPRVIDPEVRRMALRVAEGRFGELQLLRYWKSIWFPGAEGSPNALVPSTPADASFQGEAGNDADCRKTVQGVEACFLDQLIALDLKALELAKSAVELGEHPELVTYASVLQEALETEVAMSTRLLASLEGTSTLT
jgi:uncharacterized protein (DUF305 family)